MKYHILIVQLIYTSTVLYGMLRCEYCTRNFGATHNGFAEKTFHELLHGPNVVNE